jgi:O-antigen ligase
MKKNDFNNNKFSICGMYIAWICVFFMMTFSKSLQEKPQYLKHSYVVLGIVFISLLPFVSRLNIQRNITPNSMFFVYLFCILIFGSKDLDTLGSAFHLFVWHSTVIFIIFLYNIKNKNNYQSVIELAVVHFSLLSVICALYVDYIGNITIGSFQVYKQLVLKDVYYDRLLGWYRTPNQLSNISAVGLLLSVKIFFITGSSRSKISIIILSIGTWLAGSRTTLIALIIVIILFILSTENKRIQNKIKFIMTFGMALLVIYIGITSFNNRYSSMLTDQEEFMEGRIHVWEHNKNYSSDNLIDIIFGNGAGYITTASGRSTHNGWLTIYYDYGLVTFCILIAYNIQVGIKLKNKMQTEQKIYLGIICFFCVVNIGTNIWTFPRLENIYYMFCVASLRNKNIKT